MTPLTLSKVLPHHPERIFSTYLATEQLMGKTLHMFLVFLFCYSFQSIFLWMFWQRLWDAHPYSEGYPLDSEDTGGWLVVGRAQREASICLEWISHCLKSWEVMAFWFFERVRGQHSRELQLFLFCFKPGFMSWEVSL